jgi:hypothetical protein
MNLFVQRLIADLCVLLNFFGEIKLGVDIFKTLYLKMFFFEGICKGLSEKEFFFASSKI